MKSLVAFTKKEWLEQIRSGRIVILGIIFVLLGIMNPAIAKLTPWMFEIMAESLAEAGMTVGEVQVDALTSWTQFFKNIPIGLIAFILMQSNIFTKEYQSGTLVLALTKGLNRNIVVVAKAGILAILWTVYYWICYGITYFYNAYFWDNGVVQNLGEAVLCWWIVGLWTISLAVFFSCVMNTNTGVLGGTGVVFFGSYIVGLLPKLSKYVPTMLMNSAELMSGAKEIADYGYAITVAILLSGICFGAGIVCMNKKRI